MCQAWIDRCPESAEDYLGNGGWKRLRYQRGPSNTGHDLEELPSPLTLSQRV